MEDKIDKIYDLMERMYIDLKGNIKELQEGQSGLKDDIKELQEGQNSLKGDIKELQEGQSSLKSDNKELQEGQSSLKSYIKELQKSQNKLHITQEKMQSKLEQMAEIQQSHYDENKRSHAEIIRRIERIEVSTLENEAEIHKLKKAK
ncbi:MAG TPA: hypothetical protein VEG39_13945 [Clostridia bacterium]|nr:hypothetical protein [Clostridia bacterium]